MKNQFKVAGISLFISHFVLSETIPSFLIPAYPVGIIYQKTDTCNPQERSISSRYSCSSVHENTKKSMLNHEVCHHSSIKHSVTLTKYWLCSNGQKSLTPSCVETASCPDGSWVLSVDQQYCIRQTLACVPDPHLVSEQQALAALVYGESYWNNNYQEMVGIASAAVRRMYARKYQSINELILKDKNFSYATNLNVANQRYYNAMCGILSSGIDLAFAAAQHALNHGEDLARGGCFWDGLDLKTKGENAYRYKAGFKFADQSHNILHVKAPPASSRRGKNGKFYDYTYLSTAGINKTIFWQYSKQAIAAGEKQCN